jgi:AAA15 family ATPase/GTPase
MAQKFVEQIQIKNFRCFDFLKVENLKRINLIGGGNNVGKSAFLEALEISASAIDPVSCAISLRDNINRRQHLYSQNFNEFDIVTYKKNNLCIQSDKSNISLEIKSIDQKMLTNITDDENFFDDNLFIEIIVNSNSKTLPYNKFIDIINRKDQTFVHSSNHETKNITFITPANLDERHLSELYGKIVDLGLIAEINSFLNTFDPRIESLLIRPTEQYSTFKIKLKDKNVPVLLSSMGGGLNRYIAIVCSIWKSRDGQLYIDEIENGIHYTKYDKMWEILYDTASQANCQIFAVTHSKECIESFSKVAELFDHKNMKYINLSRKVDSDKIVVTVLDSIRLADHFSLGMDIR